MIRRIIERMILAEAERIALDREDSDEILPVIYQLRAEVNRGTL